METQSIDIQFQQDIQHLGLLAGSEENLEAFNNIYQQVLERNYNEMLNPQNIDKLLAGTYKARAEMLKALLQRQLDFFNLKWPEPKGQDQ